MNLILRLLLNALAVFILAHILNGVTVDGYTRCHYCCYCTRILNLLVKPILVILTLPVTIVTLGLFFL